MTAEQAYFESEEEIDQYYDTLIAYYTQKKIKLDAHIEMRTSRRKIVKVVLVVVIMSMFLAATISLKYEISRRETNIDALTIQVENLSRENTDRKKRLVENTNILEIKRKAMDLGMSYAEKEAIVYYSVGKEDYMFSYNN